MAKKKVVLSYGHGENTFPETGSKGVIVGGKKYAEHTYNAKVGEMTRKIVEAHGIETLVVQPPNGRDVPLSTRTKKANASDADLYYSFHANAGVKSARGMCAFYWSTSKEGKELAEYYAKLCKEEGLPLYNGGKYASVKGTWNDFHELRETKMVAILSENGFMTNPDDFQLIFKNKDNFYEKIAVIHAKVILKHFGVAYKDTKSKPETPAKKAAETKPKASTTYRVRKSKDDAKTQKGAFTNLASAKDMADKNKGYEVYDQNGKLIYTPKSSNPKPKEDSGQGTVKVITDSLYYYNKPNWNAKAGTVKKNEVYTVTDTLTVDGSKMLKLKSGNYLTANPKYVKFTKK